jgi:pseudouridine-5'-phosphate glycosidase
LPLVLLLLLLLLLQVTPFLLETIRSKTGGASLAANIQLVKNNAAVGSQIAVALAAMS